MQDRKLSEPPIEENAGPWLVAVECNMACVFGSTAVAMFFYHVPFALTTVYGAVRIGPYSCQNVFYQLYFYLHEVMLARLLAMTLCMPVSVCLSQVDVLSKRVDGLSWFSASK